MKRNFILGVIVLSGVAVAILVSLGLPPGHSAVVNYPWATQYIAASSWSDPGVRYLPGLWAGLGGHDFFFYAPLPFWPIATVVAPLCPGCSSETAFVLGAALFLVGSGLTMFAFLRSFLEQAPAAVGALVYVLLPYHLLLDWFERQAVGEFTAYAFLPLVALGMERLRRGTGGGAVMAIGVAGTALSHLPTALLAGHAVALLCLVFVVRQTGGTRARLILLARLLGFGSLGLCLAAFYWLPAVMLLDTVSPEVLYAPYFEAWRWLYGLEFNQPNPDFSRLVFVSFLACLPILVASLWFARGQLLVWVLVPSAFAILMNTALAEPIWRDWIIARVQFPWRMMSLVDFSAAVAAGVLATQASRWVAALTAAVALVPVALVATEVSYRLPAGTDAAERYIDWGGAHEYFSPELTEAVHNRLRGEDIGQFQLARVQVEIAEMARELQTEVDLAPVLERTSRSLLVRGGLDDESLALPVQFWALWRAETADGTALELRALPGFGTLEVIAPDGGFDGEPLRVFLPPHWSERLGFYLTVLALLILSTAVLRPLSRGRSSP